jgi:hypothetical protein
MAPSIAPLGLRMPYQIEDLDNAIPNGLALKRLIHGHRFNVF